MAYPHVTAATRWARDVVAGRFPAGKWTRLSAQRFLDDLDRAKTKGFPYKLDKAEAERSCCFVEELPHTKGKWARSAETIKLGAWQCFIFVNVFGWVHKKTGLRRFREAYNEIPRKNGKSVLAAGVGLYCFVADGEFGAEVYSGASSEKQAWEVFRPAKQMLERTQDLLDASGAEVYAKAMAIPEDGSRFEPVIGKPGDGASPSCALIDEYHEHDSSDLYDTMISGMGAREQPLAFIITTSGFNLAGPCYEKRVEAEKVLQGLVENNELFCIMFSADEDDDPYVPETLIKANPNWGISVDPDFMLSQQRQAAQNASMQVRFKTKHLNIWCSAKSAWINMAEWHAAGDETLREEDFLGEDCVAAYDLASKLDFATRVKIFARKHEETGRTHYYVFAHHYLPEATLEAEDNPNRAALVRWRNAGWIEQHDGTENDFAMILQDLEDIPTRFQVREFCQDKFGAAWIAQQLTAGGATVVDVPMKAMYLTPAMREIEAALRSGRLHHNGDPVLAWMMSNVTARADKNDNLFPDKQSAQNKIDGAVALIIGMTRAMNPEQPDSGFKSAYEDEVYI
ncbi:terminase large subunit [Chromobacterium haemolyticum]|uniref:terminase large subunit n=1 Tax=Chromobacterium haemolyticum TaxID=394935 RepID=UPI00307FABFA